eukprot:1194940-Prorocentrum_minimum.AAC.3
MPLSGPSPAATRGYYILEDTGGYQRQLLEAATRGRRRGTPPPGPSPAATRGGGGSLYSLERSVCLSHLAAALVVMVAGAPVYTMLRCGHFV